MTTLKSEFQKSSYVSYINRTRPPHPDSDHFDVMDDAENDENWRDNQKPAEALHEVKEPQFKGTLVA